MKLTLKNKNKKGGLFSFKKKSPAKTTISPKQQSFTNKLKSKLSEFIGVNVKLEKEVEQPSSKIIKILNDSYYSKFLVFYIPLIILSLKYGYDDLKSSSLLEQYQQNKTFMKQYIKLFSLILIPYLSVSKTLRLDLQDFFINLKIKLTGKYPQKKINWDGKNVIIDIDLQKKTNKMTDYQQVVDYIKNTYPDKEDQDALIKIVNHNIYMTKAKSMLRKSLLYGSAAIIGACIGEGAVSFGNQYALRSRGLKEVIVPNNYNVNGYTTKQSAGAESKFYTLFLETIGFLDDSVRNFIIPLLSNTIDQIVSFLQDPKIDPKRVLMFFLVNTVLIIFGLLFNKIKRQIKTKNLNNMVNTQK